MSSLDVILSRDETRPSKYRPPAWLLPVAIFGAFLLIFLFLFRDRLLPGAAVDVTTVLATESPLSSGDTPQSASGVTGGEEPKLLFQASGWIEPSPLPVRAGVLIDGTVAEVHVLEGQKVAKGDLLATLVDDDARLDFSAAEVEHKRIIAAHEVHLGAVETMKKKLISAQATLEASQAMEDEAEDRYGRFNRLQKGAISVGEVTSARLGLARTRAEKAAVLATAGEIESEIARLELETEVKMDEIRAAQIQTERAKLALERTRITSPISGRILRLLVAPGQKRMLAMDDDLSSTVAVIYDPAELQVRVDVPLADAAGLQVGQGARVFCGLLPDRAFEGEVTRITGEADLQKNTLQAKVHIKDPAETLRPDMLCRVEFLSVPLPDSASGAANVPSSGGTLATWVPQTALVDGKVWVMDPTNRKVAARAVTKSNTEQRDGYIRVSGELRPGETIVIHPQGLREGRRINPNTVTP